MVIVVVGLGRVGLPLASVFANCGIKVIGIEKDEKRVESIGKGFALSTIHLYKKILKKLYRLEIK